MFGEQEQYIFEIDGDAYRLTDSELEPVTGLNESRGDTWLVSDMQDAFSGFMTVEAPVKYAEVVVRKRLQESGAFEGPLSIIAHRKKKKDSQLCDVLYTAFPARMAEHYTERIKTGQDHVLLFPVYAVLNAALKQIKCREPVAVIFQHSRFADVLIGNKNTVYYANRCVAPNEDDEQIATLWETVADEIETAEKNCRIEVPEYHVMTWINSAPLPIMSENTQQKLCFIEEDTLTLNGEQHQASLLRMARLLKPFSTECISPVSEKIGFFSKKSLPVMNALLLIAVLVLAGGGLHYSRQKQDLEQKAAQIETHVGSSATEKIAANLPPGYRETLGLVRELDQSRRLPSFQMVLSTVSEALSEDMQLESLQIDCRSGKVAAEVSGASISRFDQARKGYKAFLAAMQKTDFDVIQSRFETDIDQSRFRISLTKDVM
ncbi:MAG: hypothetical protein GY868_02880 [Deltaproteobacteria bacterium]|nr:hypothetical protein [Deltaproteobacteria bacterium]